MASKQNLLDFFSVIDKQMTALTKPQEVSKMVKRFNNGNPREFKEWLNRLNMYIAVTNMVADQSRVSAVQVSKGPDPVLLRWQKLKIKLPKFRQIIKRVIQDQNMSKLQNFHASRGLGSEKAGDTANENPVSMDFCQFGLGRKCRNRKKTGHKTFCCGTRSRVASPINIA